jgi:prepilin-type N-terminal cleavage/methylation domain-containing protein
LKTKRGDFADAGKVKLSGAPSGFTLIELLAVIAIIATTNGFVPTAPAPARFAGFILGHFCKRRNCLSKTGKTT